MMKRKKINVPESIEKKSVDVQPVQAEIKTEYVLKKDVNNSLKAGMKIDKETYNRLIANGLKDWF